MMEFVLRWLNGWDILRLNMWDIALFVGLAISLMDNLMSHASTTFMDVVYVLAMFRFQQQKFIGLFASIALNQVRLLLSKQFTFLHTQLVKCDLVKVYNCM